MENRDLARMVIEVMNRRDFGRYDQYVAEDATLDFPGSALIEGRRRMVVFLRALLRRYPELTFDIENVIVDGNLACVVWSNRGKKSNSAPYRNRGITLVGMQNGKITSISDYFKDTSFTEDQN